MELNKVKWLKNLFTRKKYQKGLLQILSEDKDIKLYYKESPISKKELSYLLEAIKKQESK